MNLERLGKYLTGGSVVAGLTDLAAIIHEKITIDNLSRDLQTFIQNNNVSKETLEKTLQKLSEVKDVTFSYATYSGEHGLTSVNPLKFAHAYLNGVGGKSGDFSYIDFSNFDFVFKEWSRDVGGWGSSLTFVDGRTAGGYALGNIVEKIGGFGIQRQLNVVENTKNTIQSHQNQFNTALFALIPIGIVTAIGSYYYLRSGGGTKIKRTLGRFYEKHIRTPLAMRRMEGYQNVLYGHI
ncbi:MAG: hypothetical protein NTW30_00395 [Candidatus Aenigmarchaeota archaeon]|nr:hypothetical protein [Candidatus Aenigmarchaeota archaeon]